MQIYKAATASHKPESEDFPPPVHGSTFYNLLLTTTMNPSFAFFSLNFSSPVSEDPADLVTRAAIFISFNISFKSLISLTVNRLHFEAAAELATLPGTHK